jgi:HSP20 family protein
MGNLTEQVKHNAEQALATLSEGWRELRSRAGSALTHFRRNAPESRDAGQELPSLSSWAFMAADVVDRKDEVVVRVEAPGLSRSDFKLELLGDVLSVQGEKRVDRESTVDGRQFIQCAYGSFRRDVPLPCAVNADAAKATYRDGVLRISLPKIKGAEPRCLSIQVK